MYTHVYMYIHVYICMHIRIHLHKYIRTYIIANLLIVCVGCVCSFSCSSAPTPRSLRFMWRASFSLVHTLSQKSALASTLKI